jgi:hypothetical protein
MPAVDQSAGPAHGDVLIDREVLAGLSASRRHRLREDEYARELQSVPNDEHEHGKILRPERECAKAARGSRRAESGPFSTIQLPTSYEEREKMAASKPRALSYKNAFGVLYYLHQGTTETGKARFFFAREVGLGAVTKIPKGYEITESINGVVSLRRKKDTEESAPSGAARLVQDDVYRHRHLLGYVARAERGAIVIYEPHPKPSELAAMARVYGHDVDVFVHDRLKHVRYQPVMKFEREGGGYVAYRMTYRGRGGWSWGLASGPLKKLAKKFVKLIGTDDFFDLS